MQNKRQMLNRLLGDGLVQILFDARDPGVDVPSDHRTDAQLRLNLSYRFGAPLDLTEWGVEATLTFSEGPYLCKIPWNAIYLMGSHVHPANTHLFAEDMPAEFVIQALDDAKERLKDEIKDGSIPSTGPNLRLVPTESKTQEITFIHKGHHSPIDDEEPDPPPPPPPHRQPHPRPPHLRVVK